MAIAKARGDFVDFLDNKASATKKAEDDGSPGISSEKLFISFWPRKEIKLCFLNFFIFMSAPIACKRFSV